MPITSKYPGVTMSKVTRSSSPSVRACPSTVNAVDGSPWMSRGTDEATAAAVTPEIDLASRTTRSANPRAESGVTLRPVRS